MGSSRLPGKVLKTVADQPMLKILINRLKKSKHIDKVIYVTSVTKNNDKLCAAVAEFGIKTFCGSEKDVLSQMYEAGLQFEADVIVRITEGCPLIDPVVVDAIIEKFLKSNVDYVLNGIPPTFPDSLNTEVFSFRAVRRAYEEATEKYGRGHVIPYLRKGSFDVENLAWPINFSNVRWSVDEIQDLLVVRKVFEHFSPDIHFPWTKVIELMAEKPDVFKENKHIKRNEGAVMSNGQKLWRRAKKIIPGGNMLLSKRAEMHLPDAWPSYFSKTSGCTVWDIDGNKYTDLYLMGVGTNILGYSHPEVDEAVMQTVKSGNLSTLNAPEEVWLAEKLLELDPWAGMVRFARSGGEANAIAIRIARAAAGRDGVAVCGYHGWHDWYLSANLGENDSLAGHLLPGLSTKGVPTALRDTVHPFEYNDFDTLQLLVLEKKIGVIKMEVLRNREPENGFLERVRKLASDNGIVLIFDECTSGFRETFGGLYKKFNVEPDIAIYGKTLGNGYAVSAIVGKEEIMQAAQSTFISSTFWTERIGSTAALKTLEVMQREEPWTHVTELGLYLRGLWKELASKYDLSLSFSGLPALSNFLITSDNPLECKTFITQEMLKKGYLAGTTVYVSLAHNRTIFDEYIEVLDPIFKIIAEVQAGRDIRTLLDGPVCHSGFKRIN